MKYQNILEQFKNVIYSQKKTILTGLSSINGLKIPNKIVVFESYDWGGIRTPSLKAIQNKKKQIFNTIIINHLMGFIECITLTKSLKIK